MYAYSIDMSAGSSTVVLFDLLRSRDSISAVAVDSMPTMRLLLQLLLLCRRALLLLLMWHRLASV
jgi:hypothetical protein